MDPLNHPIDRRELLRSLGIAGSTYGISTGFSPNTVGARVGQADPDSMEWDAVSIDLDDLALGLVNQLKTMVTNAVDEWIKGTFNSLGAVYDAVTDLLAEGYADFQELADLGTLVEHGQDLLSEIEGAEQWQESQNDDSEDGNGGGGNSSTTSQSWSTSATKASGSRGSETNATLGLWPDVPSVSDMVSTFEDLSEEARDRIDSAVDNVEAFLGRIGAGIATAILDPIVNAIRDIVLAPLRGIGSQIAGLAESADGGDVGVGLDFPGLDFDLPFSVNVPTGASDTASSTATASGSAGIGGSISRSAHTQPAHGPVPAFPVYLEQAYDVVSSAVASQTDVQFDERQCRGARGPVHSVGMNISIPNNVDNLNTAFTLWLGHEPGRPCTYVGFDPDVTASVSMQDVIDQVEQNQAEAYAIAAYVRDKLDHHLDELAPIFVEESEDLEPDETPTFREVHEMATALREDFEGLESEITAEADLAIDVSAVLQDINATDVAPRAEELQTHVEEAAARLESSSVVADLLAVHDALGDVSAPEAPQLEEIVALSGDLRTDATGNITTAAFELPDLLDQAGPDLVAWITDLSNDEVSRIERAADVDLDRLRERLQAVDAQIYVVSEGVREYADGELQPLLDEVLRLADQYLTVEHEFTEGWDEWLCAGLCYTPAGPVPVAVLWIVEELWKITMDVRSELGTWDLPGPLPDIHVFDVILLVIVAVIVIVAAAVVLGISLGGIAASLAGIIQMLLAPTAAAGVLAAPIVIWLFMTGRGDAIIDLFTDGLNGRQPRLA